MIILPDNVEIDPNLGNDEDNSSAIMTLTPAPQVRARQCTPVTLIMTHSITVNYHHCYSLEQKNREQIDILKLLQSLTNHTSSLLPSTSLIAIPIKASDSEASKNIKRRTLAMAGMKKPLVFTALDITDLQHL